MDRLYSSPLGTLTIPQPQSCAALQLRSQILRQCHVRALSSGFRGQPLLQPHHAVSRAPVSMEVEGPVKPADPETLPKPAIPLRPSPLPPPPRPAPPVRPPQPSQLQQQQQFQGQARRGANGGAFSGVGVGVGVGGDRRGPIKSVFRPGKDKRRSDGVSGDGGLAGATSLTEILEKAERMGAAAAAAAAAASSASGAEATGSDSGRPIAGAESVDGALRSTSADAEEDSAEEVEVGVLAATQAAEAPPASAPLRAAPLRTSPVRTAPVANGASAVSSGAPMADRWQRSAAGANGSAVNGSARSDRPKLVWKPANKNGAAAATAVKTEDGSLSGGEGTGTDEEDAVVKPKPVRMARPVRLERPPVQQARPDMQASRPSQLPGAAAGGVGEGEAAGVRKGPILKDVGRRAEANQQRPRLPPGGAAAAGLPGAAGPGAPGSARPGARGKRDGRRGGGSKESEEAERRKRAAAGGSKTVSSEEVRGNRRSSKQAKKAAREEAKRAAAPVKVEILEVGREGLSVPDLAHHLAVNESDVVRTLFMKGVVTTVNQVLDEDMVRMVCAEYGVEVLDAEARAVEDMAKKQTEFLSEEDLDNLVVRPPVVTIMGHVDHGKTSLLDHIRKSKVAEGEAGGITQGIGAYRVHVPMEGHEEQTCVFLDTPGHEAFSAMRARGARVTDIAVIVVAADDGVRPQTLEAIAHARAAGVPMVVAINKVDKEGANPDRVMQELTSHGLMPEDWGGDTPMVPVSALTGQNVDQLLETLMLVAEFQELRANPDRQAVGTVIEAKLDKQRGPVATLLVQNGSLKLGDIVLCGETFGKIRALMDDTGAKAESAGPSTAVQVLGLSGVPVAGDEFAIMDTLDGAREMAAEAGAKMRMARLAALQGESKVTLSSLAGRGSNATANSAFPRAGAIGGGEAGNVEFHTLNVVLKVDAQGSVEAIREALQTLPQDSVSLRFLLQAPGDVSMSDIDLAVASDAVILAFNVNISPAVESAAAEKGVEVRQYRVIYDIVDDVRKAMEGMLEAVEERTPLGQAEVRAVFGAGSSKVAGVMVTEGKLVKGCGVSVRRGKKEVYVGTLDSLRRVKELAKEVVAGLECGVGVDGFNEWQEGDAIEAFEVVERQRSLEDASKQVAAVVEKKSSELVSAAAAST